MRERAIRILDSYASLLVLLLANFFLLEVVHDERWAVIGSTLLGAAALVVAISDPDTGHTVERRQWISIAVCVLLAPVVLVVNSQEVVGLTYLLPAALLVTATLPVTLVRVLRHQRVTYETVLGALCTYVLRASCSRSRTWRSSSFGTRPSSRSRDARGVGVPVLQLRHDHDARLRRSVAGSRPAAGADGARGAARLGLPGDPGRAARDAMGATGRGRLAMIR